jgi:hypothetical protein
VTTTIPEILTPAVVINNQTSSISISTPLVTSDLVVLVFSTTDSGSVTTTMNGSAMTSVIAGIRNGGSTRGRLYVRSMTGLSGTHSISYTTNANATQNYFTAFVISGLSNPSVTAQSQSDWANVSTAANTDEGPTPLTVGAGQVAIGAGMCTSGTVTFPSNPSPSSGWTNDRTASSGNNTSWVSHQIFTAADSAATPIQSNASAFISSATIVCGDAVSSSLTNTFVGWGHPIF